MLNVEKLIEITRDYDDAVAKYAVTGFLPAASLFFAGLCFGATTAIGLALVSTSLVFTAITCAAVSGLMSQKEIEIQVAQGVA